MFKLNVDIKRIYKSTNQRQTAIEIKAVEEIDDTRRRTENATRNGYQIKFFDI